MQSLVGYQVPDETLRVARATFPKDNLYMQIQAELGMIYTKWRICAGNPSTAISDLMAIGAEL